MTGSEKPAFSINLYDYLLVRLQEVRASARAGLVERALALIRAGLSFDEIVNDRELAEIESAPPKRPSHQLVGSLATALRCTLDERVELMVVVFPTYIFGRCITRLREQKGWARSDLIFELSKLALTGVIDGEKISEGWLQQIEEGRKAKILRLVVDLLVQALRCSNLDEFKLLQAADKDPSTDSNGKVSKEIELLSAIQFLMRRHPRGKSLLKKMVRSEKFFRMTTQEVFIVFEQAYALLKLNDTLEDDSTDESDAKN